MTKPATETITAPEYGVDLWTRKISINLLERVPGQK